MRESEIDALDHVVVPAQLLHRVQGSGFRVQGAGFRVQGAGFRVQGSGFRVQGVGFIVQGSGRRVQGAGLWVCRPVRQLKLMLGGKVAGK